MASVRCTGSSWLTSGVGVVLLFIAATPIGAGAADVKLAVITHPQNTVDSVTPRKLKQLFTAQLLFWPSGSPVVALNYPAGAGLRVAFDRAVLGMGPDRVGEFWVDQLVRARARPPRKLPNARLMLRVVAQLKGSVGYVPVERLTADVKVLATIRGGKVVPK